MAKSVSVSVDNGRDGSTKIVVTSKGSVAGIVMIPTEVYLQSFSDAIVAITGIAKTVIQETLQQRLWDDANSMTIGLEADAAVEKMASFGWTAEKVDRYANELAVAVGNALIKRIMS